MLVNPLSYGLSILKSGLYGHEVPFAVGLEASLAITFIFGLVLVALSTVLVSKTEEVRT